MASIPAARTAHEGMSAAQYAIVIALGALLWFLAALLIRALQPFGALEPGNAPLTYLLTIPGTLPFVLLIQRLARLRREQAVPAMALATATATLLDGVALRFSPALYGADTAGAGAVILWGAGVGLMLAFAVARGR